MAQAKRSALTARASWQGEGPLTKFAVPERKIDESTRQITFTISTAGRDRDGDIISQEGWDLKNYLENPVVLWAHDGSQPPIARALPESVKVTGGRLMATAKFATRDEYAFADTIFQLYKGGFLNATSVGFQPTEMELIEGENPGELGFKFLKQSLLEYSAVPIPSNPEALVVARGAGIDVSPCEDWISKILDEHGGGSFDGLLNRTYIALKGKLHPVMQADIADRNAAALRSKHDKAPDDTVEPLPEPEVEEVERPILSTSPGGDETHTHELQQGEPHTEGAEDDGHIHAVTYDEDGVATLEPAESHSHDLPPAADITADVEAAAEEDDDEYEAASADPAFAKGGSVIGNVDINIMGPDVNAFKAAQKQMTKTFTDWPQAGMDLPVSLLTSEYRAYPLAEAKALRDDWPEIWALAKGPEPEMVDKVDDTIRAREAWAAKHVDEFKLEDVVSQVRHLVRGSRGIEYMRLMLSHAKEHVMNERDKAKGLSPEQIDAITDRIVSKAVVPAIEKAFRQYSGRLS